MKVAVQRPDLAAGLVLLDGAVLLPETEPKILAGFAQDLRAVRCPMLYVHARMSLDIDRLRALRPDAMVQTLEMSGTGQC